MRGLDRVDPVKVFKSLTEEQLTAIVDIQLERLKGRLQERRVNLVVTDTGPKAARDDAAGR